MRKPVKPIAENKNSVASVSSIDETSISAVDLVIAKSVEKEVRQGVSHVETKSGSSSDITVQQPKVGAGKVESASAAVSALDHVGVSSVDLDIAASVEKEAESVAHVKVPDISEEVPGNEIDTGPNESKGIDNRITCSTCCTCAACTCTCTAELKLTTPDEQMAVQIKKNGSSNT